MHQLQLFESTKDIYARVFRRLCPRAEMPDIEIIFRNYRNANCYIRWRNHRLEVRHADLLMDAPPAVTESIAFILLARLYRKRIPQEHLDVYRSFMNEGSTREQVEAVRRQRGRKRMAPAAGHHYDLEKIFDEVNREFFDGLIPKPTLGWAMNASRRTLGHYDPVHHAIVLSRFLDTAEAGLDLVRYVMFHEILHIKYPITFRDGKRVIHSRAFQQEERRYPGFEHLREHLRVLCHAPDPVSRTRRRKGRGR